jgi:nitrate reductase beta subunit
VLVDQERCRGWRFCVSGCPYKKVYFNWETSRAEKCIFCYPRVESGLPTLCAEDCVGRIRFIGVLLYDADRIAEAAAAPDDSGVYEAQLALFLDPNDPEVQAKVKEAGIGDNVLAAARSSPIYKLAVEWRLALPLHPEYRTLPMVWYVPPLSPFVHGRELGTGKGMPAVEQMRIPVPYLANLMTAGDERPVLLALRRLLALRLYMRLKRVDGETDESILEEVGLTIAQADQMYELLALARYEARYVIPTTAKAVSQDMHSHQGQAGYPPGSLRKHWQ